MANQCKILVVGVGNTLLADEGVGVRVVKELRKEFSDDNIDFLDAGTDIFKIMTSNVPYHNIIVVDAIKGLNSAGTIYHFPEIDDIRVEAEKNSVHQIQIVEALKLIKGTIDHFKNTKITLIGIEPEQIAYNTELSSNIHNKVDSVKGLVRQEIENARSIACA